MRELLTPKQVARAIQVSESSVKRWCDSGTITTQYTAGGHRRIPLSELMQFLRASRHTLIRPEVVGLPVASGQTQRIVDRGADLLIDALLAGDELRCRRCIVDLYLGEHSISAICDHVIAKAFEAIGERWVCGEAEIYQERYGCEIAGRLLGELASYVPAPPSDSPCAIGASVEGDVSRLPTAMVELVLRDAQWDARSLGSDLPFETLAAAIRNHRPQLFWLSCTYLRDESCFLQRYAALYDEFGPAVPFVVGGRALTADVRQKMQYTAYCDNMAHLESCARTLVRTSARCSSDDPAPDSSPVSTA